MAILHLTDSDFDAKIANGKVLVDFWAPWCGPCRMIAPVIEQIADENTDLVVAKVNIDDSPEIASRYGVMSIPTVIVFDGGKVTGQIVGLVAKEKIEALVK